MTGQQQVFVMPGQAQPPADLMKHIEAMNARHEKVHEEGRRQVLQWAAVLCSCRKWYEWGGDQAPPQAGCVVHQGVMLGPDGEVL